MSKKQALEVVNIASQIVPFLMITALLVTISYTYAHAIKIASLENSFNSSKVS